MTVTHIKFGTVTVTNRPGTVTVAPIKSGTVIVTPEASLTLNIAVRNSQGVGDHRVDGANL